MERGLVRRLWSCMLVLLLSVPGRAVLSCTVHNLGNTSSFYSSNPQGKVCVTLRWPQVRNDQVLVINYASAFTFPRGSGKLEFPDGSIRIPPTVIWDTSTPVWSGAYYNSNTSQCNSTDGLIFNSGQPVTVSASLSWPPTLNFTLNRASLQLAYYVKTCDAQPSTLDPTIASGHSENLMHGERIKTITIASSLAAGNVLLIVVLLHRFCLKSSKKQQQLPSVSVAHRRGTTQDLNHTNIYHIVEDAYTLADQQQQHQSTVSNPLYVTAIN